MLPDTPVFGPRMRYVGMPDLDILSNYQVQLRLARQLLGMAAQLDRADVDAVVKGTLQLAIRRSLDEVSRELRALSCEVVSRTDQLNRATGR